MPQFMVLAYDGHDSDARARRDAVRSAHLAHVQPMVQRGEIILGGAILDEFGAMIGSMLVVDLPDHVAVDAWLDRDPYVTGNVWQRIEVKPFRIAVQSELKSR